MLIVHEQDVGRPSLNRPGIVNTATSSGQDRIGACG